MQKSLEIIVLLFLCALIAAAGNSVGYKINFAESFIGMMIIAAIASVGFMISKIPYLGKLPAIFWISIVAIYASTGFFPWSGYVLAETKKVQFLAICTPILAYAGLAVGKDLEMFKKILWKIIPVALAVFSGTFLFAAILAQFTLRWEGAIP